MSFKEDNGCSLEQKKTTHSILYGKYRHTDKDDISSFSELGRDGFDLDQYLELGHSMQHRASEYLNLFNRELQLQYPESYNIIGRSQ